MREYPRRRVLQTLGGLTTTVVAGCSVADEPTHPSSSTTATAARTTTTSSTRTTDASTPDSISTGVWTVDAFDGNVKGLWLPSKFRNTNTTGGPLYVGTTDGVVANLNVATGDIRWQFSVAGELTHDGYPTVYQSGQTLLTVSDTQNQDLLRNYVEKVDSANGERHWIFEEREFLSPLGIVDDTLYLGGEYITASPSELGPNQDPSGEGHLHAVDLKTGEERWQTAVPSLIKATVARHGIYAYITSEGSSSPYALVAFNRDGTERWRKTAKMHHLPKPVTTSDGVLASIQRDAIALLSPDGKEQWRVAVGQNGASQIAVTPERIYAGPEPLMAISRTGREQWQFNEGGDIVRPIQDGRREKNLYFERGTQVGAINAEKGTKRWSFSPEDEKYVHIQTVIDDGLLINTGIGRPRTFALLEDVTGDVLGEFSTDNPYSASTAVGSRVIAGASDTVYAIDVEP